MKPWRSQIAITLMRSRTRICIEVRSWIQIRIKVKIQKRFRAVGGRGRSQWMPGGYKWSPGGFVNEEQDPDSHLSDYYPVEMLT